MGVNYFKGMFYSCIDKSVAPPAVIIPIDMSLVITKDDCLNLGGEWKNADANFDNVLYAWSTLF